LGCDGKPVPLKNVLNHTIAKPESLDLNNLYLTSFCKTGSSMLRECWRKQHFITPPPKKKWVSGEGKVLEYFPEFLVLG
jgi:hypothetical protein